MTKTKLIEEQIREHYTAQNGEWLVEKGKVKEAKLLKEACLTLEATRRELSKLREEKHNGFWQNITKERELQDREKQIAERETRFEDRKASFIKHFQEWV
jgi:NDP-sugar pyrophosphorylase family protein